MSESGTSETCSDVRDLVAMGSKADVRRTSSLSVLDPSRSSRLHCSKYRTVDEWNTSRSGRTSSNRQAAADLRSAKMLFTEVRSWFGSTHIVTQRESPTNEPYRYKLRLRHGGFRAGVTVALSCLWQDCNNEGVDSRCGLRR
jgi:hypothetical protein